jgi:glucose/arabinose dehydrogenase
MTRLCASIGALLFLALTAAGGAQQAPGPNDPDTLSDAPQVFKTTAHKIRVVPIKGLNRPFAMAFLPDGSVLVTERAGRLRIIRNGVVDPRAIAGMPDTLDVRLKGLQDLALHPQFAENRLIYFTYYKPKPGEKDVATAVLGRARWDGGYTLSDVRDLFVADAWCASPSASRIVFDRDGKIFMTVGVPIRGRPGTAQPEDSQAPGNHVGKVLRLNDDGTAPADNPFVGKSGYRPEIYALGIRNILGLAIHPETGELWENENGPMGGDEINIIRAGKNYGWPVISYGRAYNGDPTGDTSGPLTTDNAAPGMEAPFLFWVPSIAPSGLVFYTGTRFERWTGSIFVGAMRGTQLQRIVLNPKRLPIARETMLGELKQRIRDVKQGPDGLLYLLTDETHGALLRLEPVPEES